MGLLQIVSDVMLIATFSEFENPEMFALDLISETNKLLSRFAKSLR
jgi:hypothetical protein